MTTFALIAALALADQTPPPQPPPAKPESAVSGVEVSGARTEVEISIDRRSYSVAGDLQGQTGSLSDVLRNIPSVQVDVEGKVSLRGDGNVTVLVDGQRSSQFTGESLAQALQAMPANRVERIEVITNPSAEFRADGAAGIINLITKKAKGAGPSGSLQAMVRDDGGYSVSTVGGYNSDKLSLTGDLAYRHLAQNLSYRASGATIDPLSALPRTFDQDTPQTGMFDFAAAHGAADYDLDTRTRLTVDVRGSYFTRAIDAPDHIDYFDASGMPVTVVERTSLFDLSSAYGDASTTWRRRYGEGHDLVLNASFNDQEMRQDRSDTRMIVTPTGMPNQNLRVLHNTYIRNPGLKADYGRPLAGKAKLKVGYEFDFFNALVTDEGGLSTGAAPVILTASNRFQLEEGKHQAYVTYQRPFGKLDVQGGLRVEIVDLDLTEQTAGVRTSRTYEQLYPTLHLGYGVGEGQQLTASYSRRVNRPGIADLNPYAYSSSAQQVTQGNVNLRPEYVDSLEAGYERRSGPSLFLATFYYRRATNAFTTVAVDQGGGVLLAQRQNLGSRQNAGIELVKNGRISARLTYTLSGNLYWSEIETPMAGVPQTRSGGTGFGRANLNWQVTPKDFLQLNLFANGKVLYPQGYSAPSASGNLGWRHKVSDKLSWMLVAQDPFATLKNSLVLDLPTGLSRRDTRMNYRLYTFTLVKTFGGAKPRDPNFDFTPGGNAGSGL